MTVNHMAPRGFLLLHGWQNHRPAGHWQHWLTGRLTGQGQQVQYPQLPGPDHPDLETWLAELRSHLSNLQGTERVVICHSLACLLWLHAVARDPAAVQVDRVLLVAPPSSSAVTRHAAIAAFAWPDIAAARGIAADNVRIVAGDDDPYCPEGAADLYGRSLGVTVDVIKGGAHLDLDAGYGDWPSVLEWCFDPTTDVSRRPASSSSGGEGAGTPPVSTTGR